MKKRITIRFTIPLSDTEWGGPSIIFYQWIPERDPEVLTITNSNNRSIRVCIDRTCVCSLHEVTDERINSWVNISVSKLKVEVVLNNIEDDLAKFIYEERESPRGIHHGMKPDDYRYEELQNEYSNIGIDALKSAISVVNRVVSYARNVKGQYWLTEKKIDEKRLNGLNDTFCAESKIDDGDWFRWCPYYVECIEVCLEDDNTSIKKDDWDSVSSYVQDNNRPNLTFELLANARYLFSNDHMRSSVIESVSALEVSVSKSGKHPNIEMLSNITQTDRIDIKNIGNQIKHMGLSGSIRYLIPLLFGENWLSTEVLEKSYKAIVVRNNVVHGGQRGVSSKLASDILNGVSSYCRILDTYTIKQVAGD